MDEVVETFGSEGKLALVIEISVSIIWHPKVRGMKKRGFPLHQHVKLTNVKFSHFS